MLERPLTAAARQVLVFAREEADLLKHSSVRTEHILLGLIRESEGIGGRVLRGLGIVLEPVRRRLEVATRGHDIACADSSAAVDHVDRVVTLALREALDLGHSFVATEHILLAIVAESESQSVAVQFLIGLGVDQQQIRARVTLTSMEDALIADGTTMAFRVESPDHGGPGLFDVNEIMEAIFATFGSRPFTQSPTSRRNGQSEGDGETLGPRTAEILRRFSVQSEVLLRFLDADTADAEFSVRYRNKPAQPFVGRVARHGERWLINRDSIRQMLHRAGIELPPDP